MLPEAGLGTVENLALELMEAKVARMDTVRENRKVYLVQEHMLPMA